MAGNLNTTNLSRRSALAGAVAAFAALPASVAFADPAATSITVHPNWDPSTLVPFKPALAEFFSAKLPNWKGVQWPASDHAEGLHS